jgi:hypothetical protein
MRSPGLIESNWRPLARFSRTKPSAKSAEFCLLLTGRYGGPNLAGGESGNHSPLSLLIFFEFSSYYPQFYPRHAQMRKDEAQDRFQPRGFAQCASYGISAPDWSVTKEALGSGSNPQ